MKIILVPTDFSQPAEWALDVASEIAKKADAKLVLLHVVDQPSGESFNAEGQIFEGQGWEDKLFTLKLIEKAKRQMQERVNQLQSKGVESSSILRLGNPFHGIRTIINDLQIDMVVMGTSGHAFFEEVLIGSNTDKVIRYAKCPVLTIHQKPSQTSFLNVVYATSLHENEKDFAKVLKTVQNLYNAKIHLVRINTPLNFRPDYEVKIIMAQYAKKLGLKDFTLNVFSDMTEEEGILHFASSINADLIAMATHGRTGFSHVLVGSIAEDVANHSTKPVLTFVTNH